MSGSLLGAHPQVIDTTFDVAEGETGLVLALGRMAREASEAIHQGYSFIVLSDKAAGPQRVPVSPLLATGCVHHHLIGLKERTRVGLLVESGEPREVHQFCTLVSARTPKGPTPGGWARHARYACAARHLMRPVAGLRARQGVQPDANATRKHVGRAAWT